MLAPKKGLLCFGPTFADTEDSYIEKEDDIAVMKATDLNMDKKLVDADEKSENVVNDNKPESNITEECVDEDESDHTTDIEILEMRKCLVHNDGISRREDDGRCCHEENVFSPGWEVLDRCPDAGCEWLQCENVSQGENTN